MKQIKRKLIKLYENSYELRKTIFVFTLAVSFFIIFPILSAGIAGALINAGYGWLMVSALITIASFCCLSVVWDNRSNK
jgi:hypothetical protein